MAGTRAKQKPIRYGQDDTDDTNTEEEFDTEEKSDVVQPTQRQKKGNKAANAVAHKYFDIELTDSNGHVTRVVQKPEWNFHVVKHKQASSRKAFVPPVDKKLFTQIYDVGKDTSVLWDWLLSVLNDETAREGIVGEIEAEATFVNRLNTGSSSSSESGSHYDHMFYFSPSLWMVMEHEFSDIPTKTNDLLSNTGFKTVMMKRLIESMDWLYLNGKSVDGDVMKESLLKKWHRLYPKKQFYRDKGPYELDVDNILTTLLTEEKMNQNELDDYWTELQGKPHSLVFADKLDLVIKCVLVFRYFTRNCVVTPVVQGMMVNKSSGLSNLDQNDHGFMKEIVKTDLYKDIENDIDSRVLYDSDNNQITSKKSIETINGAEKAKIMNAITAFLKPGQKSQQLKRTLDAKRRLEGVRMPVQLPEPTLWENVRSIIGAVYFNDQVDDLFEYWDEWSFGDKLEDIVEEFKERNSEWFNWLANALCLLQLGIGSRSRGIFAVNEILPVTLGFGTEAQNESNTRDSNAVDESGTRIKQQFACDDSQLVTVRNLTKVKSFQSARANSYLYQAKEGDRDEQEMVAEADLHATREEQAKTLTKPFQFYFFDPLNWKKDESEGIKEQEARYAETDPSKRSPRDVFFCLLKNVRILIEQLYKVYIAEHVASKPAKLIWSNSALSHRGEKYQIRFIKDVRKAKSTTLTNFFKKYQVKMGEVVAKSFPHLYRQGGVDEFAGDPDRKTHELRRLYVCYSYQMFSASRMKEMAYAQRVLGHKSQTTSAYYTSIQIMKSFGTLPEKYVMHGNSRNVQLKEQMEKIIQDEIEKYKQELQKRIVSYNQRILNQNDVNFVNNDDDDEDDEGDEGDEDEHKHDSDPDDGPPLKKQKTGKYVYLTADGGDKVKMRKFEKMSGKKKTRRQMIDRDKAALYQMKLKGAIPNVTNLRRLGSTTPLNYQPAVEEFKAEMAAEEKEEQRKDFDAMTTLASMNH